MSAGADHGWCGLPWEVSNFQGHYKCNDTVILGRPRTYDQLQQLLRSFPHVKGSGVGHSWWREQFCAGEDGAAINILTTEFDHLLDAVRSGDLSSVVVIDESAMMVTAPAGLTQRALLEHLANYRSPAAPEGYTLGSFSWFIDQTIGGAVSTGSHGSSLLYGSLSNQLTAVKFVDGRGDIRVDSSASSDPHLWRAVSLGVGRLGILLEVTFGIVHNKSVRRNKQDATVEELLVKLRQLQDSYVKAKGPGGVTPDSAWGVWNALRPWNDVQVFWHVPLRSAWLVTFDRFDNDTVAPPPVIAMQGDPEGDYQDFPTGVAASSPVPSARGGGNGGGARRLPAGAFRQRRVEQVGVAPGMERGAMYWAGVYAAWLNINVQPETLPARRAFLSLSEMENLMFSPYNSYDQYELAVPLSRAADCLEALSKETYSGKAWWNGFRTPALIRFVAGDQIYLSPSSGGPALYINIEDHVSYATGRTNEPFQAFVGFLRMHPACKGRMHWGKAGWNVHSRCFDGAAEYGEGWCHFGCAVRALDPDNKFRSESTVWAWAAEDRRGGGGGSGGGGAVVADFGSECCGGPGGSFDSGRCSCARSAPPGCA